MGAEVDYQVAAPAETSTPNWHRAEKSLHKRVRMEGWRQRRLGSKAKNPPKKKQNRLDSHRPSHGRTWRPEVLLSQVTHSCHRHTWPHTVLSSKCSSSPKSRNTRRLLR